MTTMPRYLAIESTYDAANDEVSLRKPDVCRAIGLRLDAVASDDTHEWFGLPDDVDELVAVSRAASFWQQVYADLADMCDGISGSVDDQLRARGCEPNHV